MESEKNIEMIARKIRNKHNREWRAKNKDRVKAIQKRYWEKKANEYLKNNKNISD